MTLWTANAGSATQVNRPSFRGREARHVFLPVILLYLGPPILRAQERSGTASLSGVVDAILLLQIAWWTAAACWGLITVLRNWGTTRKLVADAPLYALLPMIVLWGMFLSVAFSPARIFSLASAGMMALAAVASLDLAVRLRAGTITIQGFVVGVVAASWILVALGAIVFAASPSQVAEAVGSLEIRVRGGTILNTSIVAPVALLGGAYLAARARGLRRWVYLGSLPLAGVVLVLSRSRTALIAVLAAGLVWLLVDLLRSRPRSLLRSFASVAASSGIVLCVVLSLLLVGKTEALDAAAGFLVRDEASLSSLSGRTTISSVLLDRARQAPLGTGFAAGPRVTLFSSERELGAGMVNASRIGNAHNAYLEVLAGAGVIPFVAFVLLCVASLRNLMRARDPACTVLTALLVTLLVYGLTGSEPVLPLNQASPLLGGLIAVAWHTCRPAQRRTVEGYTPFGATPKLSGGA